MASPRSQSDSHSQSPTPSELQSWASEAPLRLVAAALHTLTERTGARKEIEKVLADWEVELTPKWPAWWDRVRPMLKSEYFKRGKAHQITALCQIADIPAEPLPPPPKNQKKASESELKWRAWLAGEASAPPQKTPTKSAQQAMDALPAESIPDALAATTRAATDLMASDKPRKQEATGWAELLSKAAARWQLAPDVYVADGQPAQVGALIARLVEAAGFPSESGRWLCQAGALLAKQPEVWRKEFAAGMWQAIGNSQSGSRQWLRLAFQRSTDQDKAAIIREITLAALSAGGSASAVRHIQIDGLLEHLPPADRAAFLQDLVVRAAAGTAPKHAVLDCITHTRHSAESPHTAQGLTPLALAALLLADGPAEVADRAARRIGELLANPPDHTDNPVWDALLADGRQRFAALNARLSDEMERQRLHYEERLAESQQESERLNRQAQRLRAELEAGREASKLDIRQDMLTVISETLQSLRQSQDNPEQTFRRAAAGLSLALRAGDAAEFGTVGDTVPYDPTRHQPPAGQAVPLNAAVRIAYPGAIIPGKLTGDRVILKARVVCPTEVN